jgi:hypothetical protein
METNDLIQDFADAWELVRESLMLYGKYDLEIPTSNELILQTYIIS